MTRPGPQRAASRSRLSRRESILARARFAPEAARRPHRVSLGGVGDLLVLWDVDYTLVRADGLGTRLYEVVFRQMFGRELLAVTPKAGRTDWAIILDTLALAGVPEPRVQVDGFLAALARQVAAVDGTMSGHVRAMAGASPAITALASSPLAPSPSLASSAWLAPSPSLASSAWLAPSPVRLIRLARPIRPATGNPPVCSHRQHPATGGAEAGRGRAR